MLSWYRVRARVCVSAGAPVCDKVLITIITFLVTSDDEERQRKKNGVISYLGDMVAQRT